MNEVGYWACCDGVEHECEDLTSARIALEQHEAECHTWKRVGRFGRKVKCAR